MATTIKLKNSVTATNAPSSLVQGEVAINITDKKVWVGNAATTPIQLLGGGADGSFTNISVSSVATFGAGTVSAPSITTTGDTNTGIFFPAADTIAFTEGGVESVRITSAGDVGIGATAPNGKLEVVSTSAGANTNTLFLTNASSNASTATSLVFGVSTAPTIRNATIQAINAGSNAINLAFLTSDGDVPAERMRITSAGNVGIGTSSPDGKLTIETVNSNTPRIRFQNASFDGDGAISTFVSSTGTDVVLGSNAYINSAGNFARFDSAQAGSYVYTNRSGLLLFGTNDSSGVATERMRIDSDGVVRINNTSNATFTAQLNIQFTTSKNCGIYSKVTDTSGAQSHIIFGNTTNDSVGGITTSASATAYATSSDYRLKENIAPMTGALATVSALKPVTYKWKVDGSNGEGFIAHELQEICPSAVTGVKDGEQMQGVDYGKITPLLTAALQEALAKIESLEARLAVLESK